MRARFAGALTAAAAAAAALCLVPAAHAGNQQYEALSAAVQSALAASISDRNPPEPLWDSVAQKVDWLSGMSEKLPRRHKPSYIERMDFLNTVRYEAQRAGLEPELVLGLIQVESGFRRFAISSAGARGYMQVMPFWSKLIGSNDPRELFDMRTNIRFGCVILRHYLDIERGDLYLALGRYNGSRGRPEYPNAVLAAWNRWKIAPKAAPAAPAVNPAPALSPSAASSASPARSTPADTPAARSTAP